jgi:maltooligosyltrehalose trehalohydrolase
MTDAGFELRLGARVLTGGVELRVWAPHRQSVDVVILGDPEQRLPLEPEAHGYFSARIEGLAPGSDYYYLLDGDARRPDPASRHQPRGVHGPSRIVDPSEHAWTDAAWAGRSLEDYVIYEAHIGTFTREGTFDAAIERLPDLAELGVTALEIMPVAAFPGERNWGYDGAYLFAPQHSYGGPSGLKRLVEACHAHGLAVVLDVVYNHLGPEGNYLGEYGPYFTDRYQTPWGSALNYDGADSDGTRRLVLDNALFWLREYHVDALRLDAIHGIYDFSAQHLLAEMQELVEAESASLGRPLHLIAESDLNDVRVIAPRGEGGFALAAQWSDDFHHSAWTVLGGGRHGYFADFGRVADLAKALEEGFVYDGRRSEFRRRRHGSSAARRPGRQLVVYVQNHDQVANASQGRRIAQRLDSARERLAAVLLVTAPNTPLLFMGQEYGETNPFHYFVDHGDTHLLEAVRDGRRREMEEMGFGDEFADPTSADTFERSKLDWSRRDREPHARLLSLYRELLVLRRDHAALKNDAPGSRRARWDDEARWLVLERTDGAEGRVIIVFNFSDEPADIPVDAGPGRLQLELCTDDDLHRPPAELALAAGAPSRVPLGPRAAAIYATPARVSLEAKSL